MTLETTLADRSSTHGDMNEQSTLAAKLKELFRESPKWGLLSCIQREALDHLAVKTSRILCGDPSFKDHWLDLQGYTARVTEDLNSRLL